MCVTRHSVSLRIWRSIWESTQEKNHTNVQCVTNVLLLPVTCTHTNVLYTVTGDHMNVHSNYRPHNCPFCGQLFKTNRNLICHIHTHLMKSHSEGTSLVTFVWRNSPQKVTLRITYFDMKMWSRMFAVNVQSVSIQHVNWHVISLCTLTTNSFVVVYVVKTSNVQLLLKGILRSADLNRDLLLH